MKRMWFKFYGQDFLTDPKMMALNSAKKTMWIALLCLVSTSEEEGIIKNITEERLKILSGILPNDEEWEKADGTLKHFQELKMIKINDETIQVLNFQKRQQPQDSYDPDAVKERVKRFRNKDKSFQETEMKRQNRIEKNRIEKNRIIPSVADAPEEEINKLIELFKPLNPMVYTNWFKINAQRKAADRLCKKLGWENLCITINSAEQAHTIKFAPHINSPLDLEKRLKELVDFSIKHKQITNFKGKEILGI